MEDDSRGLFCNRAEDGQKVTDQGGRKSIKRCKDGLMWDWQLIFSVQPSSCSLKQVCTVQSTLTEAHFEKITILWFRKNECSVEDTINTFYQYLLGEENRAEQA